MSPYVKLVFKGFLLTCILLSGGSARLYGQIIMARYVRGGDQIVFLYVDFDKKRLMALKKADESLGCLNCYRDFFVISRSEFEQMTAFVTANCKSTQHYLAEINEDIYLVSTGNKATSMKLNSYEGKLFFRKLKNWIFYNTLPDLNRAKIPEKLLHEFIESW